MGQEVGGWQERIEYDIYVPTVDAEGRPLDPRARSEAREALVEHFGGLTDMRHRNEGLWKVGGNTVRDEIVVWRVLGGGTGDDTVARIAEGLRVALGQEALLVVKRKVEILE